MFKCRFNRHFDIRKYLLSFDKPNATVWPFHAMPTTRNRYGSAIPALTRCRALWYSDNSAIAAFSGRSTRRHRHHTAIATFPRCIAVSDFDLLAILSSSKMV
jgi:hypothetical protein